METVQPLAGITVVEMAQFITAPLAGMMLADLGATVIKVERPEGDPYRSFRGGKYSPHFRAVNRTKKSVTIDLTSPDGLAAVKKLARQSDVFLENFRPGFLDGVGLGYADLSRENDRLVYCSVTGFGATGPYRARPCYDTIGQALSGLLSLYVDPEDPKVAGTALSDSVTGLYTAFAILGGLMQRERTGRGLLVETSMMATAMSFIPNSHLEWALQGTSSGPYRKAEVSQCFALRCSDGTLLAIHLSSPEKFWTGLVAATGSSTLASDRRFAKREGRIEHYEELRQALAVAFEQHSSSYWSEKLVEHDVPFAPIYSIGEVERDPQVQAMDLFQEIEHPTEGSARVLKSPIRYNGDTGSARMFAPPTLGEHTEEILSGLGYSQHEIDRMRADSVV
jgi:formyl-CoA transferase